MGYIALEALLVMPLGQPECIRLKRDQNGNMREAVIWNWFDSAQHELRKSLFCKETGEYLGEC